MKAQDLSQAKDPDLRGSLAAMQRAAGLARKVAMQTNTGIVIVQDSELRYITADELRMEAINVRTITEEVGASPDSVIKNSLTTAGVAVEPAGNMTPMKKT